MVSASKLRLRMCFYVHTFMGYNLKIRLRLVFILDDFLYLQELGKDSEVHLYELAEHQCF